MNLYLIAIFLANVNLQTVSSDYHLYTIYYTIVWFSLYGKKNLVNELLTSVTDRKYILPFINLFHQLFYVELSLPEVTISEEQTQCKIGGKSKISSLKQISYWENLSYLIHSKLLGADCIFFHHPSNFMILAKQIPIGISLP